MADNKNIPVNLQFMQREAARRQREREEAFAASRVIAVAYVNALNGSIDVPNQPGYVWVSTWGIAGSRYPAYNKGFALIDQTPVQLAYAPQRPFPWEIIDLYTSDLAPNQGGSPASFRVSIHGKNHQVPSESAPGKDPVRIYQPAIDMLKSEASSGLLITVRPLIYLHGETIYTFGGTTLDLSPYVPATPSNHHAILIYLDKVTTTTMVSAGAEIADTSDPVPPDVPANAIPSAFFTLANGQTTLSMVDDYVDARPFLSSGSGTQVPESAGQILFALTTSAFTPEKPVIDETGGTIVVDESNWTLVMEG